MKKAITVSQSALL